MPTVNLSTAVRDAAPGVRIIDIKGEINAFCEAVLADAHEEAAAGGVRAVIVNFTDLEYMNSGGIGLLVTMLIRAQRADHKLIAYGLTEHYRNIFSLTRLDEAIGIYEDEASAFAAA